ncbi:hypothetical protein UA08_05170 [Talaromyces atroroseus]|uniref:C2H2-type domain-containing protein n=1 Tax=Talaromyces atroroseus TaxID=1441469 RepID=A0A225AZ17_TALAT|nr:hypothetical protein UA08_05170 [Talaromyces atroroseus]OKL59715.1 hypothetical protein UA08_05170 [Talaromyces atroroseus]
MTYTANSSDPYESFSPFVVSPDWSRITLEEDASFTSVLNLSPENRLSDCSGNLPLKSASMEYQSQLDIEDSAQNLRVGDEKDTGCVANLWDNYHSEYAITSFTDPNSMPFDSIINVVVSATNTWREQSNTNRGLPRRRSRHYLRRRSVNPGVTGMSVQPSYPLMRWQQSPPEDEPAALSTVRAAVQRSVSPPGRERSTLDSDWVVPDSDVLDPFRTYRQPRSRAASTTSCESMTSNSSQSSFSSGATRKRPSSLSRKIRSSDKDKSSSTTNIQRPFCCTFCCDTFKNKYDWMRHEKSLHLNLENWVCIPFGGTVVLQATGRTHCAYCNMLDPTSEHLSGHNHGACDGQLRKFRRKDHLVQHLRLVHRLTTLPLISDWKIEADNFESHCGFCDRQMSSWSERCDHLALHFRNGCTMADWKGDHGFPPSIACQVTRAVPPYLIHHESQTLVPFSATNRHVDDHFSQMLSRAMLGSNAETNTKACQPAPSLFGQFEDQRSSLNSYTQILVLHLCHYAEVQSHLGIIPTDEMFQREARRLLFDSDDPWNQTIADRPEWLADFREQHGY